MSSHYLCLLHRDSRFSLSMLHLQRNSNATTDLDAMTAKDVNSFPLSFVLDPHHTQVPLHLGSIRESTTGAITSSRMCGTANSNNKHVGFEPTSDRVQNQSKSSRHYNSNQEQVQQHSSNPSSSRSGTGSGTVNILNRDRNASASGRSSSTQRLASSSDCTSTAAYYRTSYSSGSNFRPMLVPLTSMQSNINNLCMPINKSENNALPQSKQRYAQYQKAVPTDVVAPTVGGKVGAGCLGIVDKKVAGGNRDLISAPGIPYWNVYEYQDFRQMQHGQPHLFDPMTDPNSHRESLILDSYNRLTIAYPYFRRPNPIYHVR